MFCLAKQVGKLACKLDTCQQVYDICKSSRHLYLATGCRALLKSYYLLHIVAASTYGQPFDYHMLSVFLLYSAYSRLSPILSGVTQYYRLQ